MLSVLTAHSNIGPRLSYHRRRHRLHAACSMYEYVLRLMQTHAWLNLCSAENFLHISSFLFGGQLGLDRIEHTTLYRPPVSPHHH